MIFDRASRRFRPTYTVLSIRTCRRGECAPDEASVLCNDAAAEFGERSISDWQDDCLARCKSDRCDKSNPRFQRCTAPVLSAANLSLSQTGLSDAKLGLDEAEVEPAVAGSSNGTPGSDHGASEFAKRNAPTIAIDVELVDFERCTTARLGGRRRPCDRAAHEPPTMA